MKIGGDYSDRITICNAWLDLELNPRTEKDIIGKTGEDYKVEK